MPESKEDVREHLDFIKRIPDPTQIGFHWPMNNLNVSLVIATGQNTSDMCFIDHYHRLLGDQLIISKIGK